MAIYAPKSIQSPITASGGNTVTRYGEKKLHIFTGPGTFTVSSGSGNIEVMVVAGGGGGSDR